MLDGGLAQIIDIQPRLDAAVEPKQSLIIGIDPGLRGAGVAVNIDGQLRGWFDTPTEIVNKRRSCCCSAMATDLVGLIDGAGVAAVWVERQHCAPFQSRLSAFTIGDGYGAWRGIVSALGLPLEIVRAVDWQKEILRGVEGDGKERSLRWAGRRFPSLPLTPRTDGRADAAAIAEYGRRRMFGGAT